MLILTRMLLKFLINDRESINGLMEKFTKENGKITKCKVMVLFTLRMGENMKENIMMTKNKVAEFIIGLTDEDMMANGKLVISTEKE